MNLGGGGGGIAVLAVTVNPIIKDSLKHGEGRRASAPKLHRFHHLCSMCTQLHTVTISMYGENFEHGLN